jgi:hypothetical protein
VLVRFKRANCFPASAKAAVDEFVSLFHRYGYIFKPFSSDSWLSVRDERWQLEEAEILKAIACVHQKSFIGCRSGRSSRFAVLDIDAGSKYHCIDGLKGIQGLLAQAGIHETNLYRSSESGGWHLYIFFDAKISSRDLYNQLNQLFKLSGYDVEKGSLEIFPNPGVNSVGQGLRLPLQLGWAWLNDETLAVRTERSELSPMEALNQFLSDRECGSNSEHQFHQLRAFVEKLVVNRAPVPAPGRGEEVLGKVIPIRNYVYGDASEESIRIVRGVFQKLPPGILPDSWVQGRSYYSQGLTAPGQRAHAIECLSHYLFYGDPERSLRALGYGYQDERSELIQNILVAKNNGFSKDMSKGQKDALTHATRAANWTPVGRRSGEIEKPAFVMPIEWQLGNAKREALAKQKILVALEDFEEIGRPFSMRDLRLKTGCSVDTLKKHEELWRDVQIRLQAGLLASDPGVINAGEIVRAPSFEASDFSDDLFELSGFDLEAQSFNSCDDGVQRDMSSGSPTDIRRFKGPEIHGTGDSELGGIRKPSFASIVRLKAKVALLGQRLLTELDPGERLKIRKRLEVLSEFLAETSVVQLWLVPADLARSRRKVVGDRS